MTIEGLREGGREGGREKGGEGGRVGEQRREQGCGREKGREEGREGGREGAYIKDTGGFSGVGALSVSDRYHQLQKSHLFSLVEAAKWREGGRVGKVSILPPAMTRASQEMHGQI